METFVCTHCGAVGRQEEAYWAEEEPLCQDCADTQTAICDRCGERYYLDNMVTDTFQQVCTHCYDDYYTRCHHCGEIIPNSQAYYMDDDEDYPYCPACYDDVGVSIHPYSYKPASIFYGNAPRYFGVELEVDDGGKDSGKARQVLAVFNQNTVSAYSSGGGSSSATYTITATAGTGGDISTGKYVSVGAGESAGFTFTPSKGYQIADVLVNGKRTGAKNSYAFTNVRSNQTIHVTFKVANGHTNPQTNVTVTDGKKNH